MNSIDKDESVGPHSLGGCALSQSKRTIKPDQAPYHDESVVPPPLVKTEQDLDFLQRCFREALSGEIENWPVTTFQEYQKTLSRSADLLGLLSPMPAPKLSYGERLASMAIIELSRKISASGKGRKLDQLITGLKH